MTTAVQASEPWFSLGESPVWDAPRQRLLWVDIVEGLVMVGTIEGDAVTIQMQHHFEGFVGSVAVAADGAIVVAESHGLTRLAVDGSRSAVVDLDGVKPYRRLNDGACDAAGRFLVGTLSLVGRHEEQQLLQVAGQGVRVLDDDLGLANGLAFSPDGATLYSVDSIPGRVWRRSYDQATGATGERTLLLDLPDLTPDGIAVDCCGHLWIAMWGRGEVRCYATSGELKETISVPAPHTSSLAFVGEDLDQLLITTARTELSDEELARFPSSGSLFLAKAPCRGLPTFTWTDTSSAPSTTDQE